MMDYSKMSDFEVNLKIAHIILGKDNYDWNSDKKEVYLAGIDGGEFLPNGYFDPCNNPSDAWPIITANKISIYAMSEKDCRGHWGAEAFYPNKSYHFNDNPLRAAMVVFLMMQESK